MKLFTRLLQFNSSRSRLHQENAAFAAMVPAGALVLDAGAGDAPYRSLFQHTRYESADFEKVDKAYAKSTYVCDLREILVEDERFDSIIFNQVMEHLPEPKLVLAELHRVLRNDGIMLYTGPLFYEEHEQPYDFYRYTKYGLTYLFESTGFEIQRVDWLEGYFGTIGYQLNGMRRDLPSNAVDLGGGLAGYFLIPLMLFSKIICAVGSIFFHRLEMRLKFTKRGYPKNYIAILKKGKRCQER